MGAVSIAFWGSGAALLLATVPAFGAGWGWNGLFTHAVVRAQPHAPARASAYLVVGAASGGVIGPVAFGLAVQHRGYSAGWALAAMFLFAASLLLLRMASKGYPERSGNAPAR